MMKDTVIDILFQFAITILCAGGVVGVLMGATMLVKPERIAFLNQYFSGWVSTEKINDQLDRPRWIERYVYRHHRLVGGVLLIGAIFVLYTFLFSYNMRRISTTIAPGNPWLWDALVALLLVGGVLAALVGGIVFARPSLLREIEKSSNRWVATDGMLTYVNAMHRSFDQLVLRHRKIAGLFLIVGGLYILIFLGPFLWWGGWIF